MAHFEVIDFTPKETPCSLSRTRRLEAIFSIIYSKRDDDDDDDKETFCAIITYL